MTDPALVEELQRKIAALEAQRERRLASGPGWRLNEAQFKQAVQTLGLTERVQILASTAMGLLGTYKHVPGAGHVIRLSAPAIAREAGHPRSRMYHAASVDEVASGVLWHELAHAYQQEVRGIPVGTYGEHRPRGVYRRAPIEVESRRFELLRTIYPLCQPD